MSQTKQQEQGAAAVKPGARKDWEWFWRIIAGLMLVVIAWVVWVLYQISPRSVVTPLAYASQVRPAATNQPAAAAQEAVAPTPPPQEAGAAASDRGMDAAQAAAPSGARQAVADAQASAPDKKEEPVKGLRLATELSTLAADKPRTLKAEEGKPAGGAALPAATKDRP